MRLYSSAYSTQHFSQTLLVYSVLENNVTIYLRHWDPGTILALKFRVICDINHIHLETEDLPERSEDNMRLLTQPTVMGREELHYYRGRAFPLRRRLWGTLVHILILVGTQNGSKERQDDYPRRAGHPPHPGGRQRADDRPFLERTLLHGPLQVSQQLAGVAWVSHLQHLSTSKRYNTHQFPAFQT